MGRQNGSELCGMRAEKNIRAGGINSTAAIAGEILQTCLLSPKKETPLGIHNPIKGDLGQMVQHVQNDKGDAPRNPGADSQAGSPQRAASEEISLLIWRLWGRQIMCCLQRRLSLVIQPESFSLLLLPLPGLSHVFPNRDALAPRWVEMGN